MRCDTLQNVGRRNLEEKNCWIKLLFLFSLCTNIILVASQNWSWATYITWTVLPTSLLRFWALIVIISLLSMEGQRALRFHQKYLHLCSEDERRSYGFGTTWEWVINDRIFILGWTIALMSTPTLALNLPLQ